MDPPRTENHFRSPTHSNAFPSAVRAVLRFRPPLRPCFLRLSRGRCLQLSRNYGITALSSALPFRVVLRLLLSDFPYSATVLTCLSLFGDSHPGGLFDVHISSARILGHLV